MADTDLSDIEALSGLLERERAALKTGDLEGLARLAATKEALVGRLARLPADHPSLAVLRREAARNGELLNAAAHGLEAAMARLKQIVDGPGPLVTYDGAGRRTTLTAPAGQVTRRA